MLISDWSSDVCSSDLRKIDVLVRAQASDRGSVDDIRHLIVNPGSSRPVTLDAVADVVETIGPSEIHRADQVRVAIVSANLRDIDLGAAVREVEQITRDNPLGAGRSEEHTSELQSLMRISNAVFCLKKKKTHQPTIQINTRQH